MRFGIVAEKVGMSSVFNEKGERVPVTLLKLSDCQIVDKKNVEKHGYNSVVIGVGQKKVSKLSKPLKSYFAKQQISPKTKLKEFRVFNHDGFNVSDVIGVNHFIVGQFVDVTGVSIGKGFAGVMKRHNFRGLEASHGVSISHRSHGSTGGRQDPGRVFKNKKMAGHMGGSKVTTQNLRVVSVDVENGLLILKGNVPGPKGGYVCVKDAVKKIASFV
jgi:large subunit ribosomal protein L3